MKNEIIKDKEWTRTILKITEEIPENMKDAVYDEFVIGAIEMRSYMVSNMGRTKRAPWFYTKKTGKKHFPSAPGEFPAIDSGNLTRADVLFTDARPEVNEVELGATANYAHYLEDGTPKGQMKARPFIAPTIEAKWNNILNNITKAAGDEIK